LNRYQILVTKNSIPKNKINNINNSMVEIESTKIQLEEQSCNMSLSTLARDGYTVPVSDDR
jgi:hypothetical protein